MIIDTKKLKNTIPNTNVLFRIYNTIDSNRDLTIVAHDVEDVVYIGYADEDEVAMDTGIKVDFSNLEDFIYLLKEINKAIKKKQMTHELESP